MVLSSYLILIETYLKYKGENMDKQLQDIRDLSRAFVKNEIGKNVDLTNYKTDQELKNLSHLYARQL